MSTLEDRLQGGSSTPWIPVQAKADKYRADGKDCNSDETLIGTVVDHFTRDNFNGDGKIDVIVLALDSGGEVAVHCGPTVLSGQMRAAAPVFGEKIGVKYLGVVSRSGSPDYHDYRVVTDRNKGGRIAWTGEPDEVASYVDPPKAEPRHESSTDPVGEDYTEIPF